MLTDTADTKVLDVHCGWARFERAACQRVQGEETGSGQRTIQLGEKKLLEANTHCHVTAMRHERQLSAARLALRDLVEGDVTVPNATDLARAGLGQCWPVKALEVGLRDGAAHTEELASSHPAHSMTAPAQASDTREKIQLTTTPLWQRRAQTHASQGRTAIPTNTSTQHARSSPKASRLCGKLARPLTCRLLVTTAVGLVHLCNVGHQRVVGVRVRQQGADGEEHLGDRQSR